MLPANKSRHSRLILIDKRACGILVNVRSFPVDNQVVRKWKL